MRRQRRQDAAHEIRAGAVVHNLSPGGVEDRGDHVRGGRLAIGAADDNRALDDCRAKLAERRRVQSLGDQPGRGGAAAAPGQARSQTDHSRSAEREAQAQIHRWGVRGRTKAGVARDRDTVAGTEERAQELPLPSLCATLPRSVEVLIAIGAAIIAHQ